ncbi:hypothetical protein DXG03_004959 [Asterophora parasitica]|uniref:Acyltransferase MbtK/IucB-like conserved domain-containing protein n=1 Tax=Asterophora parasitica TaxID=117018 RepID=A0A9P7GJC8_9AGAR|nr:hypothetical protein DXG03_004959 [Asterophora parasitica]
MESSSPSTAANRRLLSIHNHTSPIPRPVDGVVLVLPTGGKVTAKTLTNSAGTFDNTQLRLNETRILDYHFLSNVSLALELSAVGTRYEGATDHVPKANLLEIAVPGGILKDIAVADVWTAIYALFTLYRKHEHIPIRFSSVPNSEELSRYLLLTGLGRPYQWGSKAHAKSLESRKIIFLSRSAFWQGAGSTGYHDRGWILSPAPVFPNVPSFTRSDLVIASHPLRPPKPRQGEVMYRRYCAAVGQTLELVSFDLYGNSARDAGGLSRHMAAFHRWHNDERVNSAWGERGSLETHREYVEGVIADPGVVPLMMSWDGELMGYVEIVWVKENHVAQHYLSDTVVGDWERGIHVLVGEDKFLGGGRGKSNSSPEIQCSETDSKLSAEIWLRSLAHYLFLYDARIQRVIGEPKQSNVAMVKAGYSAGFHLQAVSCPCF